MIEEWRTIPGFPLYEASNLGRIRAGERVVRSGPWPGTRIVPEIILAAFRVCSTGYTQVKIKGKKHSVHRLIGRAWCKNFFTGAVIDHINSNRSDNRAENLEWVTHSENALRSYRLGRIAPCLGKFSAEHPTSKPVVSICMATGQSTIWNAAMDAVRAGFNSGGITRCCQGKSAYHKGHTWGYATLADTSVSP